MEAAIQTEQKAVDEWMEERITRQEMEAACKDARQAEDEFGTQAHSYHSGVVPAFAALISDALMSVPQEA